MIDVVRNDVYEEGVLHLCKRKWSNLQHLYLSKAYTIKAKTILEVME